MPIFSQWQSGVHDELDFVVRIFNGINTKNPDHVVALEEFRDALEESFPDPPATGGLTDRRQLMLALQKLAEATVEWKPTFEQMEVDHPNFRFKPEGIDKSWFSETGNMWRFDSELSPHQMHLIMRETGAQMAKLLLDRGLKPARMLAQCNHECMKVEFYLDDDEPTYSVWIYAPTNSGWKQRGETFLPRARIVEQLKELTVEYPKGRNYGKGTPARQRLINDIVGIVSQGSVTHLPFEQPGVPFRWGLGYESPAPADGEPKRDDFPARRGRPDGTEGDLDGFEITWGKKVPSQTNSSAAAPPASLDLLALDSPIRWYPDMPIPEDLAAELDKVQANILRPHYRDVVLHLLLTVREGREEEARRLLAGCRWATALDELQLDHDPDRKPSTILMCGIATTGLDKLGLARPPAMADGAQDAFRRGLAGTRALYGDPSSTDPIDVLVTVAGTMEEATTERDRLAEDFGAAFDVVLEEGSGEDPKVLAAERAGVAEARQRGRRDVTKPREARTREPFGHIDGISNPWFFAFDVLKSHPNGARKWFVGARPKIALVGHADLGYGSFAVFQKLEQDEDAFSARIDEARDLLGEHATPAEAQAALVGRTPDGNLHHREDLGDPPQANDFRWTDEQNNRLPDGPIRPHIRLMNPREGDERPIIRRGVRYWPRSDGEKSGLLFLAYTSSIDEVFLPMERRGREAGDVFVPAHDRAVVTLLRGEYLYVPPPKFFDQPATVAAT